MLALVLVQISGSDQAVPTQLTRCPLLILTSTCVSVFALRWALYVSPMIAIG